MADKERLYVGVGIRHYDHDAFDELPKAVDDVQRLGEHLKDQRDYAVEIITDPTEEEAKAAFRRHLKSDSLPPGSSLVLLWSGHGVVVPEGLHLIAKNTDNRSKPDLTAEDIAGFMARCGASQMLLLLDTCYSGSGVFDAARVIDLVDRERPDDTTWFGVLASTLDFERAEDGLFVARLIRLLRNGPKDPKMRARWSVHNEGVCGFDVILALLEDWQESGQRPKPMQIGHSVQPMFPNPKFNPEAPEHVVEHLLLAAEGRAPDEEGVYFTGRTAQLDELVGWIKTGNPGVFVITGPAGCGKSAIAGRVVSLSNAEQRARLLADGAPEHADPGEGSVDAHVHTRRLTVDQVVEEIDRQLVRRQVLHPRSGGGSRNRGELLGDFERIGRVPLIVLDGLDEAGTEAWAIANNVMSLLAGVARIVIATRQLPPRGEGEPSLLQALSPGYTIDLGDPSVAAPTRSDVSVYVQKRLAGCEADLMDSEKVADAILRLSDDQEKEGAFLLARVITSQLCAEPVDTSMRGWDTELSRSIEEAFEKDLARVEDSERARELLTALAWAYGPGVPDDVWPVIANALSQADRQFDREDVYWVLSAAGRYIVEGGDGTRAVYRLSHQRMADQLHPPTKAAEFQAEQTRAARIAAVLVEYYRSLLETGLNPTDRPYLWRYTWRHCTDGGPEGIDAFRRLVAESPDAFLPGLAMALNNLGIRYSEAGRLQDAVAPTEEAVRLSRAQAENNSTFLPNLAAALNNLGIRYGEVGRRHDAVAPAEEAVRLRRAQAEDNPAFLPDLAGALNNLGIRYSGVGRLQDAVASAEEAVRLRRAQAEDNPAFLPDLAGALNNLGIRYSGVGRLHDAVAPAEEAVRLRRAQAEDNPAFLPDLAGALNNLGIRYSGVGRLQDAVASAEEAVRLRRAQAEDNPAFLPSLATALNILGVLYGEVGRLQDAVAPAEEAVRLRRAQAEDNPAFLPNLAGELTNLGNRYSGVGRLQDAVAPTEEAVDIYRAVGEDNPAFLPDLATALNNLGVRYGEVGRLQGAVAPAVEAVRLRRVQAEDNPAFLPNLAMALDSLGVSYSRVGRRQYAVAPAEEAVDIFRALAEDNPAFLQGLATALRNLGDRYSEVGREDDIDRLWEGTISAIPYSEGRGFLQGQRDKAPGDGKPE